jgi:fibronectin type 3 domain-containing protein
MAFRGDSRKSKKAKQAFKNKKHSLGRSFEQLEPRLMLEGINFVHPGIVNTAADYTRMVNKVAAHAEPWYSGYDALTRDSLSQLGVSLNPLETVIRGGDGQNFGTMVYQIATAYQSALRWKVSGDIAYANQAVTFLNAWASTNTTLTGNADRFLASGLYGYTWAAAAELMRTYSGWAAADVTAFQNYLLNVYYPLQHSFLDMGSDGHNGTYPTNYWANWDLVNIEGMMAIGIFADRHDIYQEAMNYVYNGNGNGTLENMVYYLYSGNLAQWEESGRDQGHTLLGMMTFGNVAQMAWCQGDDLFSYDNSQFLATAEYVAKFNAWQDVPYTTYSRQTGSPTLGGGVDTQTSIGYSSRGSGTTGYELIYNHYVNLMGYDAPWSETRVMSLRPEWGTGNGDGLGFGTLTFALDPIATGQTPKSLTAVEKEIGNIELDWFGAPYATSYNIYRSTSEAGTYTQIASGITDLLTYTDFNLAAGTYYYKVTGVAPSGETGASNIISATSTNILTTQLLFNETSGTTATDASGNSHNGTLLNGATFAAGKSGNAVSLDGANDYVVLPPDIVKDYNDFTISAHVYLDSASTWVKLFDFGDTTNRWMTLTVKNGSGVPEFSTNSVYGCNKQAVAGNSALPLNQWVHIAVTLSGKVAKLYVNGVVVGVNAYMDFSPLAIGKTTQDWLGRSQYPADPYFDGRIDDFRIYRGALKAGEIYTLATGLTAPAVPAAPASLTATAVPGFTINLSWSAVSGAINGYSVRRATSSGGPFTTIAAGYTGTTFSDTWRTVGTTYYYVVTAANTGGDSEYSPQASADALPNLPGAPTNLTTISASATSVLLSWTAISDASSYNIKRATVSGGPYTTVATGVTGTSYTNTGLTANTTYYYVVCAVNAAGESGNSNESFVTPTDLQLQLKFDDGAGAAADDVSINDHSGTLVNSPLWTTAGKINGAIDFDGTDDYVSLPTGIVNGLTTCTIATWVKADTFSNWQRIFDFGIDTNTYMFLTTQNSGTTGAPRFAIRLNNSAEQGINSSVSLSLGVWYHVALTLNGSVGILYINGVERGRNSAMTLNPSSLGATTQNYIGKSVWPDPYLNGKIDDFRIYAHAFTAAEVNALATTTRPTTPTGLTATLVNNNEADLSWNPVAGITGYNIVRATDVGGPYTTIAAHISSTSYHDTGLTVNPNGTTYYYAVTAENTGGDSTYSTTASVSLMPSMPDTPANLHSVPSISNTITVSWTAAANAASYTVKRASSDIGPYTAIATGVTTTTYTNTGLTNGMTYYYVVAAVNATGTSGDSNVSSAVPTNDARLHLKFNETSGTLAADSSGYGRNGTLINGSTWTSGKIFNSVSLDGSNDYVSLPTGVVNGISNITISTWVYLNASTTNMRIFDFGSGTSAYMFLTPTDGAGTVRFAITNNGSGSEQSITGASALPTGVWTHVAVTLSGGIGRLYVNGTQVGQKTGMTLTPSSLGSTIQNYIGKSQYTTDAYLNGRIDDFRIYNRALSASEINALATTLAPSTPTGLIAAGSNASVSLSWSSASGATSYNIKRSLTSGGPYTTVTSEVCANSYTDTGLTNGTTYYYVISAVNIASESNNSSQVYATPNAAPTDITLSNATVAENQSVGTEVGTFSTTDLAPPAGPFVYTLVSGDGDTGNGSFTIDSSGHLFTAAQFDYESQASYSIRVRSTDQGGLWYEKAFTISITNVPETYTWDGGSTVDSLWSTPDNWVGNLPPQAGDYLVFPAGAARLDNVNDYPAGTAFGSITVSGSGYKFTNGGNTTTASIQVQSGAQVETDKIVTGTLTIGAGAKITITPIAGGALAANSALTPLTTSALQQNLASSTSQTSAESITTPSNPAATIESPTYVTPILASGSVSLNTVASIIHNGALNTEADFALMRTKIAAGESPWIESWSKLLSDFHAQLGYTPHPQTYLIRGTSPLGGQNYSYAENDVLAAYLTALRWKITGDIAYADKSISILNGWASTCMSIEGDTNASLAAGLQGYEFAIVGEIMRDYSGWIAADFTQFQNFMKNVFFTKNQYFLTYHHGTPDDHYWANWDLCNIASSIAIGVLADDVSIYNYGVDYFKTGIGNGNIDHFLYFMHPGKMGQFQESGRDQGHSTLGIPLLGAIAQIAWNQGEDLYSLNDNAILAVTEYISKYNLWYDVPFTIYINSDVVTSNIGSGSRGSMRPGFYQIYNHYVNVKGMSAPWTAKYIDAMGAEGGGGDQLGYTSLTASLEPIANGIAPSGVTATIKGATVRLDWWGSAYATSYTVKRSTSINGPYTDIATGITDPRTYTDTGIISGTTYYYVITAVTPTGDLNSTPISAVANGRLQGAIIGTPGSWNSRGNTIWTVFDDGIRSYYDAANVTGDWAGLDFGNGVTNRITQVRFSPRPDNDGKWIDGTYVPGSSFGGRMVGGQFQGSNDPNFASGVVTLYTITTAPPSGVMTSVTISNTNAFRYVRYLGPTNGSCNVAEVEFYGYNVASAVPAVPTGLTASAVQAGVSLTWTAASGAFGYDVKRASTNGGPYTTIATGVNQTSFIDTLAAEGATNYYVVAAANAAGSSTNSAQASVTTLVSPTGLTGTPGLARVNLAWTASPGATSYSIKRSTVIGGPYIQVGTTSGTTYSDTGVSIGKSYYYVVSALNATGESRNSTQIKVGVLFDYVSTGGTPLAFANNSGNEGVAMAFDRSTGTKWFSGTNAGSTGWIRYDLGAGVSKVVSGYQISSANDMPTRDPKNWQFQGSNNGTTWTTLDTRSGETFASRYQTNTYDTTNTTAYRYYRLNITANNGGTDIQMSEFALYAPRVINAAPTDISLSNATLAENLPVETVVGTFSTTDPVLPAAPFIYTLVSGTGSTDNSSFTINASGQLLTAAQFNYEAQVSYSIRVRSTDSGGLWFEKAFTIDVTNLPETYTWDGGSAVDSNWSTPENWVGDIAPTTGDSLVFPAGAARLDNLNDYPDGIAFGSITVSGSGYKFSNSGNTIPASIQVQSGAQLEADKIVTGTLTIGAGAKITITPIAGGALATNSALTPLTTSALQQKLATSTSQTSAESITTPSNPAATITSTAYVAPISAFSNIAPVQALTNTISTTALNNNAGHRIPSQLPAAHNNLIVFPNILKSRLDNPLDEIQANNKTKTSAITSLQDGLPLFARKYETSIRMHTVNQQAHFMALQSIMEKADQDIVFNTADNIRGPKHIQKLGKAVDEVLTQVDGSVRAIL